MKKMLVLLLVASVGYSSSYVYSMEGNDQDNEIGARSASKIVFDTNFLNRFVQEKLREAGNEIEKEYIISSFIEGVEFLVHLVKYQKQEEDNERAKSNHGYDVSDENDLEELISLKKKAQVFKDGKSRLIQHATMH